MTNKNQIVIIGGGAAGLELATKLGARFGHKSHNVILVERNRTHVWKPLLHEVATGSLDANLDEIGYRSHCHRWGYRFFHGSLQAVDTANRQVHIAPLIDADGSELIGAHTIRYDYLVLAYGSVTNDFGTPGVAENCIFLDDRTQADMFRDRLLNHCLRVSRAMTVDRACDAKVKIAIVGAGATGVELAAELYNAAAALGYFGLEVFGEDRLEVTILEAGQRILPALPETLSEAARIELEKLGVRVATNMQVISVTADAVMTQTGERINADLRVWAAGVKGAPIAGTLGAIRLNRSSQVIVRPTLQCETEERVFAIGDCAYCILPGQARPVPPRAQAAHQMAKTVYRNLLHAMKGEALENFAYKDHGSLVSLSRFSTVGSLMGGLMGGGLAIRGRIARFVYTSLYRMHIISIHGWIRGLAMIAIGRVNAIVRPRLKLH